MPFGPPVSYGMRDAVGERAGAARRGRGGRVGQPLLLLGGPARLGAGEHGGDGQQDHRDTRPRRAPSGAARRARDRRRAASSPARRPWRPAAAAAARPVRGRRRPAPPFAAPLVPDLTAGPAPAFSAPLVPDLDAPLAAAAAFTWVLASAFAVSLRRVPSRRPSASLPAGGRRPPSSRVQRAREPGHAHQAAHQPDLDQQQPPVGVSVKACQVPDLAPRLVGAGADQGGDGGQRDGGEAAYGEGARPYPRWTVC